MIAVGDLARIKQSGDPRLLRLAHRALTHPYYTYRPRPDDPAHYDEQEGFFNSTAGVAMCVGGNGCLAPEQPIYDPVKDREMPVGEINENFYVWSRAPGGAVQITEAKKPFVKGADKLYRVVLDNGNSFIATSKHRVLTVYVNDQNQLDVHWTHVADLGVGWLLEPFQCATHVCREVVAIEYVRTGEFYDLHVPVNNNYFAAGCWHHNSGKTYTAAMKAAKFLLERQPPPKQDTPFWCIANTYEQVCGSAWFQKLREIIPPEAIDHRRITWKNVNRGWPYSVPLKPWPDKPGKNWVLEFKSYEQGREQMQATAIGGAWFTEQFPWEVFEEVLRGCREYMFPGGVFCDFTPIDPGKSIEVERAYEGWATGDPAYKNFSFHRMNTAKALEAGHCQQTWYDTFYAMVSEEMLETRLTGAFASYEGAIYQSFNPRIHLLPEDHPRDEDGYILAPRGVWHRRSIDWGASAEHPFVCLWAYKNSVGQYFFYDEYWNDSQLYTALDHVEEIKERRPWDQSDPYYGSTYGDPSNPGMIGLFGRLGVGITPANNDVLMGIETVRRHLKKNESLGEPMFFIDPVKCPHLAKEMRTYRWDPRKEKPTPVKEFDDTVDAMRYLLHTDCGGASSGPKTMRVEGDRAKHGVRFKR